MTQFVEWDALANILVFGILVGAGLPTLFAVGVRLLAGHGAADAEGHVSRPRLVGAYVCFGLVVLAILGAVAYIAAGGH
ncbi:hypothetical protein [Demequina litorisediminis]|uniref:Uncharacterized protein n=1 Tax=Demequina litorisediminis TaxID=1849022 RepID=A0ABQ6IEJ3_9MICO|nr:hypothetical protein [Demequina litorisediminis]GMA35582.1 hypothetical protein GCM10025876_17860 [Demequina litorisediminis]